MFGLSETQIGSYSQGQHAHIHTQRKIHDGEAILDSNLERKENI